MMAAAAAPRLRPLLRALRLQTPRGPLLPHRPLLGLGPAPRALSTAGPQAVGQAAVGPDAVGPAAVGQEVRLEELGLGACSPVGLVQNLLQFLHLDLGLPWWGAIALGTVGARAALLPLLLGAQRQAARLAPHLPHLQRLAHRLQHARRHGDPRAVTLAYTELAAYQKAHDVNPLRGFLVPLVQMAAAPVPGLRAGGLAWFPDLAAPDPFYVLPLLVTASTWLVLEVGAEAGLSGAGAGAARRLLRLLPLLVLPFILHFPTAIFTYWLTSNAFSLVHTGLLRVPAVRAWLRVPPPPPPAPPQPSPGLLQSLRKGWREAQAAQRRDEREWRVRNHLALAAKGPLRQTFAHNPLEQPGGRAPAPPPPPKRPWKDTLG
ncbi:mitochondrial inner membrane protein OXA1L isoform X2 [Struthio camelus]|uniref:mitochondrial inner membrane protein OXA1L isoform X2 n=1 Tax=Struthio camelus TaxID=8801 RepID=UPI003604243B